MQKDNETLILEEIKIIRREMSDFREETKKNFEETWESMKFVMQESHDMYGKRIDGQEDRLEALESSIF